MVQNVPIRHVEAALAVICLLTPGTISIYSQHITGAQEKIVATLANNPFQLGIDPNRVLSSPIGVFGSCGGYFNFKKFVKQK